MSDRTFSICEVIGAIDNPFANSLLPSPGFSVQTSEITCFQFHEQARVLNTTQQDKDDIRLVKTCWIHDPTGLEAEIEYKFFYNSSVLELSGRIFNRSDRVHKAIKGPFSLFIDFDASLLGTPHMTTLYGGGSTASCYPPPAYKLNETTGLQSIVGGREGGRSTETEAPYAFITNSQETHGLFFALEWPCRWIFCATEKDVRNKGIISILAHVAYTGFELEPGDSIYVPKAILGFFEGSTKFGSNIFRRHISQNISKPIINTKTPPVFYNSWYAYGNDINTEILRRDAQFHAAIGVEYFVVDAGWFDGGFRNGIGNWEIENSNVFPDGMAQFADYVRSLGMKFGSWLEIEFAMKDSHWVRNHPEWFHYANKTHNYATGSRSFADCLLKLDDDKVRSQVLDFLVKWVEKYGIEWLRWDFNNTPAPFWDENETENTWGRIQLNYGEGLYRLLDDFMEKCPQVHLEACAGGGHRMDLGTLRRAHSAWMNDLAANYHSVRCFQRNLNRFLTANYANSTQTFSEKYSADELLTALRSKMAGSLGFSIPSNKITLEHKEIIKKEISNYKQIRHFLLKDYYSLFDPSSLKDYDGWQFHDIEKNEGFFMIFRCDSSTETLSIVLPGLASEQPYIMTDIDIGKQTTVKGGEPFSITISKPNGTCWMLYKKG